MALDCRGTLTAQNSSSPQNHCEDTPAPEVQDLYAAARRVNDREPLAGEGGVAEALRQTLMQHNDDFVPAGNAR